MGSKINPGKYDCYKNAEPDEPMFVLLARDTHAPAAVRKWAEARERFIKLGLKPLSDLQLVEGARECARAMEIWRSTSRFSKSSW